MNVGYGLQPGVVIPVTSHKLFEQIVGSASASVAAEYSTLLIPHRRKPNPDCFRRFFLDPDDKVATLKAVPMAKAEILTAFNLPAVDFQIEGLHVMPPFQKDRRATVSERFDAREN